MRHFSRACGFDFPVRPGARVSQLFDLPGVTIEEIAVEISQAGWKIVLAGPGVRYTREPIACEMLKDSFPLAVPISVDQLVVTFYPPDNAEAGSLHGILFLAGTQADDIPQN